MNNNYCVIMGGGIGSRFWPFSREKRPKQFLDFFGNGRSLIQMTFDRFAKIIPVENIYVVTNEDYALTIREQIPEMRTGNILLEPSRRNTAPCIAYAAYHIRACNPNANIVVAPSDHLILKEDIFLKDVEKGLQFVAKNNALLTLGIKPSRPETAYGYIQSGESKDETFLKVKAFTEKPNPELAELFIASGEFYWNSGIFFWNVDTIIKAFADHLPDMSNLFELGASDFNTPNEARFIEDKYSYCQIVSIDIGIMEKANNVCMMCVDFGWADLGTWGSLYELAQPKDENNNAQLKKCNTMMHRSSGNLIATDNPDRLIVVEDLNDYIIAESDNVLLICKKSNEDYSIKRFIADAKLRFGNEYS